MNLLGDDGDAETIFQTAGFDPADPPGPAALIERILGDDSIRYAARLPPGDAMLIREDKQWRVLIRHGLNPVRETWALAHELAEYYLRTSMAEPDIEHAANRLAACLIAPRAAFIHTVSCVGHHPHALAKVFITTESCMILRRGEVFGTPIALVTPNTIHVRGECWKWPCEHTLRNFVHDARVKGFTRMRLSDDPRKIALIAEQELDLCDGIEI